VPTPSPTCPLRILELRSVWGTGGGPEKTILLGAAQADRSRYEVTVSYIRDERDPVYGIDQRAGALPVDYVELREKHSLDPGIWPKLRALVRERHIDIVHAHEYKTDLFAWLLARCEPVVPLSTAHGWTGHTAKERRVYYPADRWLLARYPRVVAVSSEIRDVLVRAGARRDRIDVLLNSIDPLRFRRDRTRDAAVRAGLGFPPDAAVIGAVGRLEPQKNFPLLLEVFTKIADDYPKASLVIAGDGSLKEELLTRAAATGLGPRIRLLGHREDIDVVHHAFDLFVQSSDYEGTPNAVLEAMALENPIVATSAGGTAEVALHGLHALIVPCGDGAALERALRDVLTNPGGARARAAVARLRVEGDLSFQARMRRLESIYDQLVTRYPRTERGRRVPAGDMRP
jgi:glycosyltransferase involved in cell wall biosynthesis